MIIRLQDVTSINRHYLILHYSKTPKNLDTGKFAVIALKVEQGGFTLE